MVTEIDLQMLAGWRRLKSSTHKKMKKQPVIIYETQHHKMFPYWALNKSLDSLILFNYAQLIRI